ncbi:amidase [Subtercola boreus]|uniref:Amidase n=1 Tax=Subtercola boreus TaxID=120213 RepID=A0A3E0WBD7_9MICO|nr:amidase [Subtercola boreus]RFA20367.1 amidase [Subtercola boreus]RFA20450.1 amidase [Subtercola boreus]RFA26700.1 amidase [Subtercola boreus]
MPELHDLSALDQWRLLQKGEVGVLELTEHYLARIERLDPELGAFFEVTADRARERARFVERQVPRTTTLWGLPFADKDLVRRQGVRTTFGSRLFEGFLPEISDDAATDLDAAGGVSLGKTATPEFGLASYTESLVGPPTRNPYDVALGPGGSSGGAAVAVASGMLPFAPGSDGGGSIRIPAAATGLVGLKPSRGRVPSGSGIGSLAGLPVTGPLARSVTDAALLLDGLISPTGAPPRQPYSLRAPENTEGPFLGAAVRGEGRFQLGVMTDSPWDLAYEIVIDPEVQETFDQTVDLLATLGHGIEPVSLEPAPEYPPAFRSIWQAGAALLPADASNENLLEPLTRWLMHRGRALGAAELGSALATLSGFERSIIRQFSTFDAIVTPTLALPPRPIGWYDPDDGEKNFAQQVLYSPFTSFVNVSGLPAITLPVGETRSHLPIGVQLIGRPGGEATLLSIGRQLERRLRWELLHPPVWSLESEVR